MLRAYWRFNISSCGMGQRGYRKNRNRTESSGWEAFGLGAQVEILLPYSRLDEAEADRQGLIFMAMARYDPNTAVAFWQRMAEKKGGESPTEFLSTHPADEARIRKIKETLPEAMAYYTKPT